MKYLYIFLTLSFILTSASLVYSEEVSSSFKGKQNARVNLPEKIKQQSSESHTNSSKAKIASTINGLKSFKEWKNERVQIAIKRLTITRAQIEYRKLNKQIFQKNEVVNSKDLELEKMEIQLKSDKFALEAAQELTVTDYFAIYLTKQENKSEAYKEAAQKMSPEEVADLVSAYADSMLSASPSNSSNTSKSRLFVGDSYDE